MTKRLPAALAGVLFLSSGVVHRAEARSAVFGGGPFYSGGSTVMNNVRSSGFHTVVLWTIHVRPSGDLWLNDQLVVASGAYVGHSAWPGQLATLKQAPTSVNRIEVAVGSWGVADFETIRSLIAAQGTGSGSILYRNFLALKNATGADAVDFDDESAYDVDPTVRFGVMLADIGYRVSLCPYTNSGFWTQVRSQINGQRPGTVDRVYLQVYAGGAGNSPSTWSSAFGGFKVDPGLWCRHGSSCTEGDSPSTVQTKMAAWKSSAGIVGGFMWLYDDMQKCSSQGTPAQYAAAINNVLGGTSPTPTPTPTRTPMLPTPTPTSTPTPPAGCVEITPPASGVTASTSDANVPANTVDNNLGTRWSGNGDGAWLKLDLGTTRGVSYVKVAVYGGNARRNRFDVQASSDNVTWTTLVAAESSGTTTNEETYDFADVAARYIRYLGHGNIGATNTAMNSVTEISVYGCGGTPTPTPTTLAPTPTSSPTPTPAPTATPGGSYVEVTPGASGVLASANDGNLPANTVDNNLATRWSANGDGQWLQLDLGAARTIGHVNIAFYNGNLRRSRFDLQVSNGGGVWSNVVTGALSSGTTTQEETFDFADTSARWVRYLGHGNTTNGWNSLLEVSVFAVP